MPRQNVALANFNRGLLSSKALARVDIKRAAFSAEIYNNWTPRVFGSMMLRPGSKYLASTVSDAAAFFIPFIFSTSDTANVEVTDANVRIWISDALMSRESVSTSITNGTFDSNVNSWTDADESGGTSGWLSGSYMSLIGDGTNAAKRYQKITVSSGDNGTEHALRIIVERGPVTFRVGSALGADNFISETALDKGEHSLAFTPTSDFYIEFESRLKRTILVDSVAVESSGVVSITAPWAAADITKIRYDQSGDIIFIACDGYQQFKIERRTTRSWSVVRYYADDGPFRTINLTNTTITPSALSGNVTLTASTPIFQSGHKEGLFRLASVGQTVSSDISAQSTWTNVIKVTGVESDRIFQITRAGTWVATVTLQRSQTSDSGPWEDVTTYTTNATISYDDGYDNLTVWYRIGVDTGDYTSGTAELTLDYAVGSIEGIARIKSDEKDWVEQALTEASNWYDVAWAPSISLFAAVAYGGTNRVATSPDGVTWTARSAVSASGWRSVCWSEDLTLFCSVGTGGTDYIQTSPDGITWTARTESDGGQWHSVCWSSEETLFVTVSSNAANRVMTSPDGTTWTGRSAAEDNSWQGVAWSPDLSLFCAVGSDGTNQVMTSPDGITWTARAHAEANTWRDIAWSPELTLFAACASDGTNRIMTSPDGENWTARAAGSEGYYSISWSPELGIFYAVGISGNSQTAYSSDGITWTARSDGNSTQTQWSGLTWSPELRIFCAVSQNATNRAMITTSDGKNAIGETITDFGKTDATEDWYEGAWSTYRGWPTAVAFAEGRLFWAGKNNAWGSISDGYYSYDDNVVGDSGTIGRTIGSGPVDAIQWILALNQLLLGSEGKEHVCKSSALDEPLTPTAFAIRDATSQGSASVEAQNIDDAGVFIQRGGTRLFRIAEGDRGKYVSEDLTLLVPEILLPQVKRIAIQRQPDTRIICVLNDGTLAIAVFDRAEDVLAWYTHSTDGSYEDVVVLPGADGTGEDAVYFVVNRTIDSSTVRYLERIALESECQGGTLNKQLDSFLLYSGSATATITGLTYLEGESVEVWGDGKYNGTYTVSGGQITGVTPTVSEAVIGLTYTAQWKSTKLAYASGLGTALTQKKKVEHMGLILQNTHKTGLQYGPSFTKLYDLPDRENGVLVADDTIHNDYDEDSFEFGGEWDTDARICLQAVAPKPCTVLAAVISVETHDKG